MYNIIIIIIYNFKNYFLKPHGYNYNIIIIQNIDLIKKLIIIQLLQKLKFTQYNNISTIIIIINNYFKK